MIKRPYSKAFTIIEALVAIVLMTSIFVVFFTALMTSFNNLRRVKELRTASLVLQEQVSIARELHFPDIQTLGGTFNSTSMSSLSDAAGTIVHASYNGQNTIEKIAFRLTWTGFDGRPMSKTLVTLITDHGIDKK